MNNKFILRKMFKDDFEEVSDLIFHSTNLWYEQNGKLPIFSFPESTKIFCEIYEALDPDCCILAVDIEKNKIAGSCFYHPRETHLSLGIMNVHPFYFGHGIARKLLDFIIAIAKTKFLPLRLISSALNLDSFSLYSKAGFVPYGFYQDMTLQVPSFGFSPPSKFASHQIREANINDIPELISLETKIHGISREKDYKFFINNEHEIWHTSVLEQNGKINGFLASSNHPGSRMVGPGFSEDWEVMGALIYSELNHLNSQNVVAVVPSNQPQLVKLLYSLGAKNSELHVTQSLGPYNMPQGIVIPTFMPETG